MDRLKMLPLAVVILLVFVLWASPARAIPGDVNGDGLVNLTDETYFISYLFAAGPPPVVRNDADVDNCPGVNLGDALQIVGNIFTGAPLFVPVGTDLVIPSEIKITTGFVRGTSVGQAITLDVKINTVAQPNLYALIIPLSYADLPGETQLTCTGVSFTGTLMPTGSFIIDAPNKRVLVWAIGSTAIPVIPTGSSGVIARINFTVAVPGTHNEILPYYYSPEHTILLISQFSHLAGNPPGRMLVPKFYTSEPCDANGDNQLNLPDIVYLINFLFRAGPPPINDP